MNVTTNDLANITSSECAKLDCAWCVDPLHEGATILYMQYFNLDVTKRDMVTIGQGHNFTQENTLMFIDTDEGPNSVAVENDRLWIRVIREDSRSNTLVKFHFGWAQELCKSWM